jgi:hypothetical protein
VRSCFASRQTPKLEGHPLSAVCDCLFKIFAATLRIWRPSPCRAVVTGIHISWYLLPYRFRGIERSTFPVSFHFSPSAASCCYTKLLFCEVLWLLSVWFEFPADTLQYSYRLRYQTPNSNNASVLNVHIWFNSSVKLL